LAYREAAPPPCAICEDNPAIDACACCRRDVCKRHLPAADKRGWWYLAWWLGIFPAAALPFVYAPLLAVTIVYVIVGFPFAMWRSKVRLTQKFIDHARTTGLMLKAPDDDNELAQNLADYEYRRRNQQVVTEPVDPVSE
jgi:hypothetical protein